MRDRTADPLLAKQVLSQLSYTPISILFRSCHASLLFADPQITPARLIRSVAFGNSSDYSSTVVIFGLSSLGTSNRTLKIEQRLQVKLFVMLTLDVRLFYFIQSGLHRKEVIQPHLPIRLPCYDFTPVANPTFGSVLLR